MPFAGLTHVAYYEELGVAPTATEAEIKRAYFKLALKYHPDKNPGNQEAEDKFKRLTHIYAILSDPERRKDYDRHGEEASDDDIEIVEGEDDGSIYTVEELERLLGHEYSKGELASIHADMTFETTKNPSSSYSKQILEAELTRARDMQVSDINLGGKMMDEIPVLLGEVVRLSRLVLSDCKIKKLPAERLTGLVNLKLVDLKANALSKFPLCFSLASVQTLLLDHNQIESVAAEDLRPMHQLRVLTLFGNKLKSFPSEITTLPNLVKLDLECNYLKKVEFDSSSFKAAFELALDPNVNTPSGKSPGPNKKAAVSAVAAFFAAAGSNGSKANNKKAPLALTAGTYAASPRPSRTPSPTAKKLKSPPRKKRSSLSDLESPSNENGDDDHDFEAPTPKRRRVK